MAKRVFNGRWTTRLPEEGVVVFLIGMRVNKWWRIDKWWKVFRPMPTTIRDLRTTPELGMLHAYIWLGRTTLLQSYWRSVDDVVACAHGPATGHPSVWREYNRRIGQDGLVGVWHETYLIRPGQTEQIYVNMPRFGLAGAVEQVQVTGHMQSSRKRLATWSWPERSTGPGSTFPDGRTPSGSGSPKGDI